jgi:hypothetical protein
MGYAPLRQTTEWNLRLIPWRVAREHSADRLYRALATEARLKDVRDGVKGATVPTRPSRQQLERVLDELGKKLVIQYDREFGFSTTDRRPGLDTRLIREPRILDDGTLVTGPVEGLRR